jgi:hypothetical protein
LITRINFELTLGGFEMDFEDGEIRFRTSMPLASPDVPHEVVGHLVFSNLQTVDRFFGSLMRVIYGDSSPKVALAPEQTQKEPTPRFELN